MRPAIRIGATAIAAAIASLAAAFPTDAPAAVAQEGDAEFALSANLTAYVKPSNGLTVPVPVVVEAPIPAVGPGGPMFDASGMPIMRQTYFADVPSALVGAEAASPPDDIELQWSRSSNQAGECKTNDSATVRACLTMYYSEGTIQERPYVRVHKYEASWQRMDRQVGLSGANVLMGASGGNHNTQNERWCESWVYTRESYVVDVPTSGHTYTARPSWAGCSVTVHGEGSHTYQAGGPRVMITRGSRSWEFWFNVVKGSL
jgi:hypothetical protein